MAKKLYSKSEVTEVGPATVAIRATVTDEVLTQRYQAIITKLQKSRTFQGFRKGAAPLALVEKELGKGTVTTEALKEIAVDSYGVLVQEHELIPIGMPQVGADTQEKTFTLTVALMPKVTLPDYKKIASTIGKEDKTEAKEVTGKDVDEFLEKIKKDIELREGVEQTVDDAFAKKIANLESVAELKKRIKENLSEEAALQARGERRGKIIEALLQKTEASIPPLLVDEELNKMFDQFSGELARSKMTLDNYLTTIGKKQSDLANEWRETAEKRVVTELVLAEIAKSEKIAPQKEAIDHEVAGLAGVYPNVPKNRLQMHVANIMTNDAVMVFLEKQAGFLKEEDKKDNTKEKNTKNDTKKTDENKLKEKGK